jgi:hypothetical protein
MQRQKITLGNPKKSVKILYENRRYGDEFSVTALPSLQNCTCWRRYIFFRGGNVGQFTRRDVLRAIYKGDIELLESYFKNGLSSSSRTEQEKWNLLHQATVLIGKKPDIGSIKLLLSKGVDANAKDYYGNIPLHYAVRNNDIETVRVLSDGTTAFNTVNAEGVTSLHQALTLKNPNIEIISFLVKMGADPNVGSTLNFAKSIDNREVNQALGVSQ